MKTQEDLKYIDSILAGDTDAFTALVNKYKDMVFTIIVKIVGNEADAEELSQDVFLKVYHSLGSFKRESRFSTWIYRIAYNAAITKTRKKKLETQALNHEMVESYTQDDIQENVYTLTPQQQKSFIDKVLTSLPENDYVMITLYHKEDCSVKDISEITGLSESNVKVKLHRIRKRMQKELNQLMNEHLISRKS
jgi:RNA polymerase sigma-70 factor (ECF subfamily)